MLVISWDLRSQSTTVLDKGLLTAKDYVDFLFLNEEKSTKYSAWDKCSGLVHWEDPEGWDGEGSGKGDRDGEHM